MYIIYSFVYVYVFATCSHTQHTKKIWEDLIAKRAEEAVRDSPQMRKRRIGKPAPQRGREKPHSKPDTVIQRLLDRFDPKRLTAASKLRRVDLRNT